ncbi:hypothetical protein SYK_02650 [Pseudodesulfovibrio nedwellii]|uniref:Uncharacterized protein n=1 Tax=Pseudodesulfovibrio nedwellii TaxID=2973072 RepID=A0ABN6S2I4_9BACT|nr:hypothetical protein [Pseudodesulfovibrio nedwellii]BDQ35905.1 hypothetical protein SYK_02650 [Pseudodesulfovibrio nedwellii]
MDAKLTIHFRRQDDGSTLATAVMIESGSSTPRFFRMPIKPDVDPWTVYADVANQAVGYLKSQTKPPTKSKQTGSSPKGRLIQLQGVLTT